MKHRANKNSKSGMGLRPETLAIHGEQSSEWRQRAVSCPIFQTSTFQFGSTEEGAELFAGKESGYIYTRIGNPTTDALQNTLAQLEHGNQALATTSGMAAITTVLLAFLNSGDHVVSTAAVYGPTRMFIERELGRFGVESSFVETSETHLVQSALGQKTKLIFVETPANPTMAITDIRACAGLAHSVGALLVVDNTFATPLLQRPLELGADIVIHSLTKFVNGHSDTVGGAIVTMNPDLHDRLRRFLPTLGGSIDPHQAWLILRGVKTLPVRLARAQENAQAIASFLQHHPKVAWVRYPGLPEHPQHDLARRQMSGFGAVLCFGVHGGFDTARRLLDQVQLCTLAVSLGGIETLIQHPASMTHAGVPQAERKASGISDDLIRLSVGCEAAEDIQADLEQALESA